MNKNFPKTNTGITMISLVVTIVILLILAGISISIVRVNSTFGKTFESKIVTELSQLGEELNKIKINAEKDSIINGDYSGSLNNNILIKDKIILSTISINNPPVKLGIIDASKFTTDSTLGNNANSYVSNNTFENVTDLRDVYAINLETNDIYYINEKVYSLKGIIGPDELNKPIVLSEGPIVSASKDSSNALGLSFTVTVSPGKDNIPLKSENDYEYYISSKPDEIVGGIWEPYESGKIVSTEQSFDKDYYLFVKIVEDEKNKISTATGSNSADVLVNGEKYHRFGPFIPNTGGILVIDPNGGKYKNSSENTSIKGKIGDTITINSSDITPGNGSTITFDPNNGNISNNTITADQVFKNWSFTGEGTFANNVYTFAKGSGTIIANYQNLAITLPSPTRTGYTFDGWYTSKIGGIKVGIAGDSYVPSDNITLYARWTINKYTLTVNPNGGTWNNTTANSTFTQDYNTTKNIPNPIAPTGYTVTFDTDGGNSLSAITSSKSFSNWTKSGEGTLIDTTFTFGAGNATLTANYINNSITLPTPTKTGYTFDGWYTAKLGGTKVGIAGGSYTPSTNVTLYARWIINKYNIDLNLNVDGQAYNTGYNNRIYVGLKVDGQNKGYVQDFSGSYNYGTKWEIYGLKLDDTIITYSDSGTLGASNLNLTKYFYTITFTVNNTNYGTIAPTSLLVPNNNTKYSTNGSTLTLSDGRTVTATSKELQGYATTVSSWSSTSGTITTKTTITANFTRTLASYTATFNSNGGTAASPSSITRSFGQQLGTLPTTSRVGYTFNGWYTSTSGGTKISETTTMPSNNVTYYAQWTINQYTLTVNPNGGIWNNTTANSTFTQNYNTTKAIPNPTAPDGYTVTFDTDGGNSLSAQTSTKSFSNWTKFGEGTLANTTFTFGAGNATLTANYSNNSITLPAPTKTGYAFDGWYTAKTGGTKVGVAGGSYTPLTNVTLYARWTINTFNIDLNLNVDGQTYSSGYNNRIYVGLRIGDQDYGYVQDFSGSYNVGTKWEIYGLKLDGTVITYSDSGTLGASNLNLTRYFYTMTFNVNNSAYGSVSPTSLIVPNNSTTYSTSGSTLTLRDGRTVTASVINQTGYTTTLSSWTPASGTITAKTTVTANFARTTNNYTATFNSNGGTAASPSSITRAYGQQLGTLPTTSRTGYAFNGWFTAASGGTKISTTTTMPANNVTYYAQWIDNTPPVINSIAATAISASTYRLTITASDTGSGINGYYISTSTAKPNASSAGWATTTATTFTWNSGVPGTTYYAWVKDAAGNVSASKSITTAVINYSVNNTKWCTTLNEAHTLAAAGNTIYLLKNYTDSSSVTITKNVNLSTNSLTLTRKALITVNAGCTLNLTGTGTLTDASGSTSPLINNYGTFNKTGGGAMNSYFVAIQNVGTTNISAGAVNSVSSGRYALVNTGTAVIQNATLTAANSYSTIHNTNSLEIRSGTFQNTGSYNQNISSTLSGAVLYNNGTAVIGGGTFTKQSTGRVIYNDKTLTINNINLTANTKGNGAGILSVGTLNIHGGTFLTSDRVLLSNDGTMNISAGTFTTSSNHGSGQAIVNGGTTKITGGTFQGTNTALGSLFSNNGLMRISNATVTSKGSATITNETTKKWGSDICTQLCSLHITGTAKISNTGSGVAILQASTSKNGGVHTPSSFTGYVYANSGYVIDNNSTSAYAKFNGGKFYSPGAKYSNGKVTFGSGASKVKGRP